MDALASYEVEPRHNQLPAGGEETGLNTAAQIVEAERMVVVSRQRKERLTEIADMGRPLAFGDVVRIKTPKGAGIHNCIVQRTYFKRGVLMCELRMDGQYFRITMAASQLVFAGSLSHAVVKH